MRVTLDVMALRITGDTAADALLTDNPLALLIGMLLDSSAVSRRDPAAHCNGVPSAAA